MTPDDVLSARFVDDPADRPPLLSEVMALAADASTEVQLDLKDWRPLTDDRLRALIAVVQPAKPRVIVSSGQNWNLRLLHRADPELAFGFDPAHYLDHAIEGDPEFLPQHMGAYGYRDDHPLAFGRTEPVSDYLRERFELLVMHAPDAREWFLNYRLVLQMLDDGFNAAQFLHDCRVDANVWTPDYRGPESLALLDRMIKAGFDRVTTNTRITWERALQERAH